MGFLFAALEPFCEAAEAACFGDSLAVFSFCSQPVELLLSFSWPDCCDTPDFAVYVGFHGRLLSDMGELSYPPLFNSCFVAFSLN